MALSPQLFRTLAWCAVFVSTAAAPFILFAVLEGRTDVAHGFVVTVVVGLFAGGVVLIGANNTTGHANAGVALRLALSGWLLIPILAAPPLVAASGSLPIGLYEAFSSLTTTGAIILTPEEADKTVTVWRCVLAWLGGLGSLVMAVTVFAALDHHGVGSRRTHLLTVEHSDLFISFGRALRRLGALYTGLTFAGVLALMQIDLTLYEALCLALSGIATAGLSPWSGSLAGGLPGPAMAVLVLLCLSGAWSMVAQYDCFVRRRMNRWPVQLRVIMPVGLVVGAIALLAGAPASLLLAGCDLVFAVTTAGYHTGEAGVTVTLFLVLSMAGGATISTSGGIKLPRILLLIRQAGGQLASLSYPSAAVLTRFGGRSVTDSALTGVWVYALAFPVAMGIGAVVLGWVGLDFETAWTVSAASLTNAGPLARLDYGGLPPVALGISALIMVIGRLEVLAAAAAVFMMFARD